MQNFDFGYYNPIYPIQYQMVAKSVWDEQQARLRSLESRVKEQDERITRQAREIDDLHDAACRRAEKVSEFSELADQLSDKAGGLVDGYAD